VHQDLGLSAVQVKEVMRITDLGPKRPTDECLASAEKALDEVLTPPQADRLQQLIRQWRMPQILLEPETVKALGLTAQQKEAIHAALPKGRWPRRPGGPAPGRGERPPEVNWKQVTEQALKVLTPEQHARWRERVGEPFQGEIRFTPPPRPGPPRGR
jgi:hypothetical protein